MESKWKNSVIIKIIFVGFLMLLLLIPMHMIESLVTEREERSGDAKVEISEKWGSAQTIVGPILNIPYTEYWKDDKNQTHSRTATAKFLPENLSIEAEIFPQVRWRGIFEAILYTAKVKINGNFTPPDPSEIKINSEIIWGDAYLSIGIVDMRGIKEDISLRWNNAPLAFKPGAGDNELFESGINAKIPGLHPGGPSIPFELHLDFQGSQDLNFMPLGKNSSVVFSSAWKDPSFTGAFLPAERTINQNGFRASWKLTYFARSFPQSFSLSRNPEIKQAVANSAFGVRFLLPVDFYQQSMRSAKYAVLFIMLTFLAFFLFEILNKLRIHPFQYLLVGFAMCLFYLLLLSLSEHIGFTVAYIVSSLATILLISGYCLKILSNLWRAAIMAGLLIVLYAYLYILLQLQDFSLLFGSIALFTILGVVMFITRNIDWYSLKLSADASNDSGQKP